MGCDSFEDGGTQFSRAEDENGEVGGGHDFMEKKSGSRDGHTSR